MSKTTVSDTKGVVEERAGTGLVVEGKLTGAKRNVIATGTTLTLEDSGAVLLPSANSAQTFTLPAVATAAGFHVTFQAASSFSHKIVTSGSELKLQGAVYHNTGGNGATLVRLLVTDRYSIAVSGLHDQLSINCDGVNYYVSGWTNNNVALLG